MDIAGIDMRLEEDGFIALSTGATDNGMGVDTILAQIAAEELGVESSLIVVRGVDTDVSPFDAGSYASSGTYVTGLAAKNAATELRKKICAKAAQMWTWMPPMWSLMASTCACPTSAPPASAVATSRCATLPTCALRTSRAATR